jgi:hypothetical protein
MQVNKFTSKSQMSAIFHVLRQLMWKNIQWNEWSNLVIKYAYKCKEENNKISEK